MAIKTPCIVTYKGQEMPYGEYLDMLANGEYDKLVEAKVINIEGKGGTKPPIAKAKATAEGEGKSRKSKHIETFNKFFGTNIESIEYEKLSMGQYVKESLDLIGKNGENIEKVIGDIIGWANGKEINASLDDIRRTTTAAIIIEKTFQKAQEEATKNGDYDEANRLQQERNDLIAATTIIGTNVGQIVKGYDIGSISEALGEFVDAADVVNAAINNVSVGDIAEHLRNVTKDPKIVEKIQTASFDIAKEWRKTLEEDPDLARALVSMATNIIGDVNGSSKRAKRREAKESQQSTKLTHERIKVVAADFRAKAKAILAESRSQTNNIFTVLPVTFKAAGYELLAVGLETYGNIRDAVKYATDKLHEKYESYAKESREPISKTESNTIKKAIRGELTDIAYEVTGKERNKSVKKATLEPSQENQAIVEQALSEIQRQIEESNENGAEAAEISKKINDYLRKVESESTKNKKIVEEAKIKAKSKSEAFREKERLDVEKTVLSENLRRLQNEQKERQKVEEAKSAEKTKEALDRIKEQLEKRFDLDNKKASKAAKEILGALLLNPNPSNMAALNAAIGNAIGNINTVSPSAVAQAQHLAQQAMQYPQGSQQRAALNGQAMQVIANQTPISYSNIFKTAYMANLLGNVFTYLSILPDNIIQAKIQGLQSGILPLRGFFSKQGQMISTINKSPYVSQFAKAALLNSIIGSDNGANALYGNPQKIGQIAKKDDLLRFGDKYGGAVKKLAYMMYAPLKVIQSIDPRTQAYVSADLQARLLYTALKNDPNYKGWSDKQIADKVLETMGVLDQNKIAKAESQALSEGYKKGIEPSEKKVTGTAGRIFTGSWDVKNLTQDEKDWVDFKVRVNELMVQEAENAYKKLTGSSLVEDALTLTNQAFMKGERRKQSIKQSIDPQGNMITSAKDNTPLWFASSAWYIDILGAYDRKAQQLLETEKKGVEGKFEKGLGIGMVGAKLYTMPFARMVVLNLSRHGDYTPLLGAGKAWYYNATPEGENVSPRNKINVQNILYRQALGTAVVLGMGALIKAFTPKDDEEEHKKQPFSFEIVTSNENLPKRQKLGLRDIKGKDNVLFYSHGKPIFSFPFGNSYMRPLFYGLSALQHFQKRAVMLKEDEIAPTSFGQLLLATQMYISSYGGQSYNQSITNFTQAIKRVYDADDDNAKIEILKKEFGSSIGKTVVQLETMPIPFNKTVNSMLAVIDGKKPDRDELAFTWRSVTPFANEIGAKPALDFFGQPIKQMPSESTDIITANLKLWADDPYKNDEQSAKARDFVMYNGLIPKRVPIGQTMLVANPLNGGIQKKKMDNIYEIEKAVGNNMLDFVKGNMNTWQQTIDNSQNKNEQRQNILRQMDYMYNAYIAAEKAKKGGW